jgi:hypothetical protein
MVLSDVCLYEEACRSSRSHRSGGIGDPGEGAHRSACDALPSQIQPRTDHHAARIDERVEQVDEKFEAAAALAWNRSVHHLVAALELRLCSL